MELNFHEQISNPTRLKSGLRSTIAKLAATLPKAPLFPLLLILEPTQPPTAACKMEAQSECVRGACTFLHVWAPTCMLSRCLLAKLLHRSSVGSLFRVCCWLGTHSAPPKKISTWYSPPSFPLFLSLSASHISTRDVSSITREEVTQI